MKLSIIVPVYNMAADGKLQFCLDSLVGQTITDYEIIAVNDASTDNSLEILRYYEKNYPEKVKVLTYAENKRQGGAKNTGLEHARGEWIGFIDSDDWVTPDFYEKLLGRAEETGADFVGCNYSLVSEHTFQPGEIQQINTAEQTGILDVELHKKHLICPGSMVVKIYKHAVIQENRLRFPEGIFYEDNYAGPLWSLYFSHFEKVEEPLYYYYQHTASTVHHVSVEKCCDRMRAMELFYESCSERGFLKEYQQEIAYCFVRLFYVNTLFTYMQGVRKPELRFIKELRVKTQSRFPGFQTNSYYETKVSREERDLIAMQCRSDIKFYLYYRMKLTVWKIKKQPRSRYQR